MELPQPNQSLQVYGIQYREYASKFISAEDLRTKSRGPRTHSGSEIPDHLLLFLLKSDEFFFWNFSNFQKRNSSSRRDTLLALTRVFSFPFLGGRTDPSDRSAGSDPEPSVKNVKLWVKMGILADERFSIHFMFSCLCIEDFISPCLASLLKGPHFSNPHLGGRN